MIIPAMGDRYLTGRTLELYEAVKDRGWISGSYATWMATHTAAEPTDIDVFCKREDVNEHALLCRALESIGFANVNQTNFSMTYLDSHGEVTKLVQVVYPTPISIPDPDPETGGVLFEVKRFGGLPEQLVANFDLSVAQAVVLSPTEIWVSDAWKRTNIFRELYVMNTLTPLNTVQRIIKYGTRGYTVTREELVKLFNEWEYMSDLERELQYYL